MTITKDIKDFLVNIDLWSDITTFISSSSTIIYLSLTSYTSYINWIIVISLSLIIISFIRNGYIVYLKNHIQPTDIVNQATYTNKITNIKNIQNAFKILQGIVVSATTVYNIYLFIKKQ